ALPWPSPRAPTAEHPPPSFLRPFAIPSLHSAVCCDIGFVGRAVWWNCSAAPGWCRRRRRRSSLSARITAPRAHRRTDGSCPRGHRWTWRRVENFLKGHGHFFPRRWVAGCEERAPPGGGSNAIRRMCSADALRSPTRLPTHLPVNELDDVAVG